MECLEDVLARPLYAVGGLWNLEFQTPGKV